MDFFSKGLNNFVQGINGLFLGKSSERETPPTFSELPPLPEEILTSSASSTSSNASSTSLSFPLPILTSSPPPTSSNAPLTFSTGFPESSNTSSTSVESSTSSKSSNKVLDVSPSLSTTRINEILQRSTNKPQTIKTIETLIQKSELDQISLRIFLYNYKEYLNLNNNNDENKEYYKKILKNKNLSHPNT